VLHGTSFFCVVRKFTVLGLLFPWCLSLAQTANSATQSSDDVNAAVQDLREQVKELREAIAEIRQESAHYRAETDELRGELRNTRAQLARLNSTPPQGGSSDISASAADNPAAPTGTSSSLQSRVTTLEEQSQLLEGKVNEQYQTKVESASKYRVRLSGIVLLNLFNDRGTFDNQDFPTLVETSNPGNPNGSFGATLRQSEIALEVFGPRLAGAKSSADIHADFAGGFPVLSNGVTSGLFRLKTAKGRLDWENTSIVAGQDEIFFSPLSPTSFASLAIPAFSYAGNLWGWIPQVRVEHRFNLSDASNFKVQAGIMDNLTGDQPVSEWGNIPQAGERSSQPAYATRISWNRTVFGQPLSLAGAGYYSRQDWWYGRHVDGWSGMADWTLPMTHGFSLSGEFYRGYAVGGLNGGLGRSVILSGPVFDTTTQVQGINSLGGWSQLKFKVSERLEFNTGFGLDNPFSKDLKAYPATQYTTDQSNSNLDPTLSLNRSALVNFIYRPHSNLLFSAEYRHLKTTRFDRGNSTGEQVNLMMGILF